jgi:hypothetical protein
MRAAQPEENSAASKKILAGGRPIPLFLTGLKNDERVEGVDPNPFF